MYRVLKDWRITSVKTNKQSYATVNSLQKAKTPGHMQIPGTNIYTRKIKKKCYRVSLSHTIFGAITAWWKWIKVVICVFLVAWFVLNIIVMYWFQWFLRWQQCWGFKDLELKQDYLKWISFSIFASDYPEICLPCEVRQYISKYLLRFVVDAFKSGYWIS